MRGTAEFQAAIQEGHVKAVVFVQLDFSSGIARLCNAGVSVRWNGFVWYGAGQMISIGQVSETDTIEARTLDIQLSGISPELLAAAQNTYYQGRPVDVWLAPLDDNNRPLTNAPYQFFSGRMDYVSVEQSGALLTLHCNNWFEDWQRPRTRRYTNADQQAKYPGDKFCEFAEVVAEAQLVWGVA